MIRIVLVLLVCSLGKRVNPPQLIKQIVQDEPQLVRLADQQKFTIPITGQTISHSITFSPSNNGECQFIQPSIHYKSLAESQAIFTEDEQITSILPLLKHQIVYIADPFYNIAAYSIDEHSLLKSLAPKKNLKPNRQSTDIVSPVLVATSDEQLVYYLIGGKGYVFEPISLSSQLPWFDLQGKMDKILKGVQFKGYILLVCGDAGLQIYKINPETKLLSLTQSIKRERALYDLEIDHERQLIYLLYDDKVDVYSFKSPDYYKTFDTSNDILEFHDQIILHNITYNLPQPTPESNINLEISRGRQQQTLLILFKHSKRNTVAEISYHPNKKEFIFIRYYKFIMQIYEIHTINDVMVVVGDQILGIFPFDIDARNIPSPFNGVMTMSPIQKLVITQVPYFVGITKNSIEYGGIFYGNKAAGLNCHINEASNLKNITFKANLTSCNTEDNLSFRKYCEYQKIFIIEQMDFSISAPIADSMWIAMIIFTIVIILGICSIFIIHKKKQQQIRKLQLYFAEKKRTSEVPITSAREGQSRL